MNGHDKFSWLPAAATVLALISCYGTTLVIGLLSLLGVSLAINERAWAGAISMFAALAAILIAASGRRRCVVGPGLTAVTGLACIVWAVYGAYSRPIELGGFALLAGAARWDRRFAAHRCDVGRAAAPQSRHL